MNLDFSVLKEAKKSEIKDAAVSLAKDIYNLHTKDFDLSLPKRDVQIGEIVHYVNPLNWHTRNIVFKLLKEFPDTKANLFGDFSMDEKYFATGNPIYDIAAIYYYCMTGFGRIKAWNKYKLGASKLNTFYKTFIISYASLSDKKPSVLFKDAKRSLILYYIYMLRINDNSKLKTKFLYWFINNMAEAFDV